MRSIEIKIHICSLGKKKGQVVTNIELHLKIYLYMKGLRLHTVDSLLEILLFT